MNETTNAYVTGIRHETEFVKQREYTAKRYEEYIKNMNKTWPISYMDEAGNMVQRDPQGVVTILKTAEMIKRG